MNGYIMSCNVRLSREYIEWVIKNRIYNYKNKLIWDKIYEYQNNKTMPVRFVGVLIYKSISTIFEKAVLEWKFTMKGGEEPNVCICSHVICYNINMEHINTGRVITVGIDCIEKFIPHVYKEYILYEENEKKRIAIINVSRGLIKNEWGDWRLPDIIPINTLYEYNMYRERWNNY